MVISRLSKQWVTFTFLMWIGSSTGILLAQTQTRRPSDVDLAKNHGIITGQWTGPDRPKASSVKIEYYQWPNTAKTITPSFDEQGQFIVDLKDSSHLLVYVNGSPYLLLRGDTLAFSFSPAKESTSSVGISGAGGRSAGVSLINGAQIKSYQTFLKSIAEEFKIGVQKINSPSKAADEQAKEFHDLVQRQNLKYKSVAAAFKKNRELLLALQFLFQAEMIQHQSQLNFFKDKTTASPTHTSMNYYHFQADGSLKGIPFDNDAMEKMILDMHGDELNRLSQLAANNLFLSISRIAAKYLGWKEYLGAEMMEWAINQLPSGRLFDDAAFIYFRRQLNTEGLSMEVASLLTSAKEKIVLPSLQKELQQRETAFMQIMTGKPAPNLVFSDPEEKTYSLSSFSGKIVVVDIWATWCSSCIKAMPSYLALRKKYEGDHRLVFLTISIDNQAAKERWKEFLAKRSMVGFDYLIAEKDQPAFTKNFQLMSVPRYFVLSADGKMAIPNAKSPTDPSFEEDLLQLLKQ